MVAYILFCCLKENEANQWNRCLRSAMELLWKVFYKLLLFVSFAGEQIATGFVFWKNQAFQENMNV